jgi:beta-glucosidase
VAGERNEDREKSAAEEGAKFLDASLPVDDRVDDLVSRMTLEEKVSQTAHEAPAIERLGVPEYNWWNECLHGVARAGVATVFPQAIGLAATFNSDLVHRVAVMISDEARAKHHEAVRRGERDIYKGLTFWSPNINIFRDPRWGRGQETYGECPHLTARLGVAFCTGLQGDSSKYLKAVATPKHFAVHSGPEPERHCFNAVVSPRDMRETYLAAFRACVVEAQAQSIMGAYNRTNGEPCCASETLLQKTLREEWGFEGYVVSDCGAINDIFMHHKVAETPVEAAALAVKNGCDLNCGGVYSEALKKAVEDGLLGEAELDLAVKRLFRARFMLGLFDPPEAVPYAHIPHSRNDCDLHRYFAVEAARQSVVLLKNDGGEEERGLLPLSKDLGSIAVIGPNASDVRVLLGNYHGDPSKAVTVLEGVVNKVAPGTKVVHAKGCELSGEDRSGFDEAVGAARSADAAILVMGLANALEGEEGEVADSDGGGDRLYLGLPAVQEELLKAVHATGTPVILVLMSGSALAVNWAAENVPAILMSWYGGEEAGSALADILFGDYCPAGRLPVTFYKGLDDLPPFDDYSMENRTYRFFKGEPLYPFGYGLNYVPFEYSNLSIRPAQIDPAGEATVSVHVKNAGGHAAGEIVQLYVKDLEASVRVPIHQLRGFDRVGIEPGQRKTVRFKLAAEDLACCSDDGRFFVEPGEFEVSVGGGQPGCPGGESCLTGRLAVTGEVRWLDPRPASGKRNSR